MDELKEKYKDYEFCKEREDNKKSINRKVGKGRYNKLD